MPQKDKEKLAINAKIHVESCDLKNSVFRIIPNDSFVYKEDIPLLIQTIENLIKTKKYHLILDLKNIKYPNTSLIANLVEFTSVLRRSGGDLLLSNISDSARMNLMTFSPLSYLRITEHTEDDDQTTDVFDLHEKEESAAENKSQEQPTFDIKGPQDQSDEKDISVAKILDISKKTDEPAITLDVKSDDLNFEDLVEEDSIEFREPESDHMVVHSREDHLYKMTNFVTQIAERAGFDEAEVSRIKIAVYEAAINIIEHAYKYDSQKFIELLVKFDSSKFTITMMDRGEGFEYDPDKDYDATEAAEEKQTGGFGLHIIKRSMDEVNYESDPKWGNRLTLIKNIS